MKVIAHIFNGYVDKFGIPRQSGIVKNLSKIVFEPEFRVKEAFTDLQKFSHVWLIWNFSKAERDDWSPTVRPPKLGGNKRVGVFATRSPFRPNPIGLSSVRLIEVVLEGKDAPYLIVEGADILNGTAIYDIKPYIPYTDCHTDATAGISVTPDEAKKQITFDCNVDGIDKQTLSEIIQILEQDPHPSYKTEDRVYKMDYSFYHVEFTTTQNTITVKLIRQAQE